MHGRASISLMSVLIGIKLRSAYNSWHENRFFIGSLPWGCQKPLSILKNSIIMASTIASSGKIFHDNADGPAKMTDMMPVTGPFAKFCSNLTPGYRLCRSLIIHVFLIRWFLTVSPTIFCQPMGTFAFFALTITLLGFSVGRAPGTEPAVFTTIGLSAPTTPADAKAKMTTTTDNRYQQHAMCTLKLVGVRVIKKESFQPYPD